MRCEQEWTEMKLADLATMKYGKMPDKSRLGESGYPVFTGYKVAGYYPEYMYEEPQVVVVARGVGGTGDVKLSPPYAYITNLSIIIELNEAIADKHFLYYALSSLNLRRLDSGSAQSQITINDLKHLRLQIPALQEQREIARLL